MSWKSYLNNNNAIDWLLEPDNPSVRYFTLLDILEKTEDVIETKRQIMEKGPVAKILSKQGKDGFWGKAEDFYIRSKYKGTVWSFLVLAELGADGNDERVKRAAEFILTWSQDRKSGGFAYMGTEKNGGQHSGVIPCLTGNMIFSMIRFGYIDDPRVQKGIDFITEVQRFDDGINAIPPKWPYEKAKNCWGKHTCHMGAAKAIKALAEIPAEKRTAAVNKTLEAGAQYFLLHHIYKQSHDISKISKPDWLKFGFPLMYQTDTLELLDIFTKLGYKDKRMQDAVALVVSKQNKQGMWLLEKTFNGRYAANIERKEKPSKWITLFSLRVLKRYYG